MKGGLTLRATLYRGVIGYVVHAHWTTDKWTKVVQDTQRCGAILLTQLAESSTSPSAGEVYREGGFTHAEEELGNSR